MGQFGRKGKIGIGDGLIWEGTVETGTDWNTVARRGEGMKDERDGNEVMGGGCGCDGGVARELTISNKRLMVLQTVD